MIPIKEYAKSKTEYADTPSNHIHMEKVGSLTLDEIMGMDNYEDLFKGKADLIDNLYYYLCDNLGVRKHMKYDWSLDNDN